MNNIGPEYITVNQIAQEQQVTVMTVRNWIKSNKLMAVKIGKSYRIRKQDYEDMCKRGI